MGHQVSNSSIYRTYFEALIDDLSEGRGVAAEVDAHFNSGVTRLPSTGGIKSRVSNIENHSCVANSSNIYQSCVPPPTTLPREIAN
jgi:hypothetical protein